MPTISRLRSTQTSNRLDGCSSTGATGIATSCPRRQLVAEIHDYVGLERRKLKPELYTVISYIICYADMAAHCLLEALCMELASAIERKEPPEYACEFKKSS